MDRKELENIGFKDVDTYMNTLEYDFGKGRFISIDRLGTPNEVVFIGQKDEEVVTDLVCIRRYETVGYTSLEWIKMLINILK